MTMSTSASCPGDRIDQYRLGSLVSRTSEASVFRATDTRTGTTVALKIPHESHQKRGLFVSGGGSQIGGRLHHPTIARTLHEERATCPYTVLEWAEGRTLRAILDDKKRWPVDDTIHIALQICEALQYIHDLGFVHLDLKPENLIVDSRRVVKLIDFGSARKLRPGWLAFIPKKFSGTPDYAAPEQIRGKSVDARSDVYSMGLVLYEMLAGELPFSGADSALALQLRLESDPPPLCEIVPEITPELSEAVKRATSRNPSKRQTTAQELALQLKQSVEDAKYELVGSV